MKSVYKSEIFLNHRDGRNALEIYNQHIRIARLIFWPCLIGLLVAIVWIATGITTQSAEKFLPSARPVLVAAILCGLGTLIASLLYSTADTKVARILRSLYHLSSVMGMRMEIEEFCAQTVESLRHSGEMTLVNEAVNILMVQDDSRIANHVISQQVQVSGYGRKLVDRVFTSEAEGRTDGLSRLYDALLEFQLVEPGGYKRYFEEARRVRS